MTLSGDAQRLALRTELKARRAALNASERLHAADAVARQLTPHLCAERPGYVGGYWAINGELPLHVVQLRLPAGKVWCLPQVQADGRLRFAPWRPGDPLTHNRFGIPEPATAFESSLGPEQLDVVLLPLLGFDCHGQRLGMGGGYYDRSFAFRLDRAGPPVLIGIGYDCQQIPAIPVEPWDVPLDVVATPSQLWIPAAGMPGR